MNIHGLDSVRGEIFGALSFGYSANLSTVETWPKHASRDVRGIREHRWFSEKTTSREALAEYIAANRRETVLGDGSPCIVTLEPALTNASS